MSDLAIVSNPVFGSPEHVPPRSLISTKLYPPRLRASLLTRPNLISLLENDPDHRLTLICAPAGYGKSTLTAQWLAKGTLPSTWVSLEASDNDPQAFLTLVVAALQSIDRGLAVRTEALLSDRRPFFFEQIVYQLIEEISVATRLFVLVLDDYHAIGSPEIHNAMDLLLQHLPMSMRLVLISRTEPPLQLARLRANGEVFQLGRQDLSFSHAETIRFYQESLGLDLTPSEIGVLHERTEGWVAGLYLAGFALRGQPRERIRRYVEDFVVKAQVSDRYLWEEVLQNQPDHIQDFLLRSSILDRFTARLCDAMMGIENSEELIRQCEHENLFILPLDEQGTWHRFHHLFAENLRGRLTQVATDAEIRNLHLKACKWLEEDGLIEDSIRHAVAGHVWEHAIRLLEELCAALFERDHVSTLCTWLEGLPPEILERSPKLAFWLAWALGRTGHWSEGTRPLRVAEEAWVSAKEGSGQGLLMLWHASRSLYALESREAKSRALRALELLPHDHPAARLFALMSLGIACVNHGEPVRAEETFSDVRRIVDAKNLRWLQPFEMTYSAIVLAQQGKLEECTVLARRVIQDGGEKPIEIWAQPALYQLGVVYLEWGRLDDALRCFRKADELAEATRAIHWRARIRTGIARIAWARGDIEEAFDEVEQTLDFASQTGILQEIRTGKAHQARFWIWSHQLSLARRWADSCDLDPYLPPEYERQVELLTYVRLLISEGRSDLALELIKKVREQAESNSRHGDLIELHLLSALAHKASAEFAEAHQSMQRALELGEPNGYLRVFVDEGADLESLLRHATARGEHRDYARHLLAEIEGTASSELIPRATSSDALSEREVEVLRLVSLGLGNREVGQRLYISEKTVKTHLSNILSKLEATNRTQAVDQARRLGFL